MGNQSAEQPKKQRVKLHGGQGQWASKRCPLWWPTNERAAQLRENLMTSNVFNSKYQTCCCHTPSLSLSRVEVCALRAGPFIDLLQKGSSTFILLQISPWSLRPEKQSCSFKNGFTVLQSWESVTKRPSTCRRVDQPTKSPQNRSK